MRAKRKSPKSIKLWGWVPLLRELDKSVYAYQCSACGAVRKVYHSQRLHNDGCPSLLE